MKALCLILVFALLLSGCETITLISTAPTGTSDPTVFPYTFQTLRIHGTPQQDIAPKSYIVRSEADLKALIPGENRGEFVVACSHYGYGYFINNDLILIVLSRDLDKTDYCLTKFSSWQNQWSATFQMCEPVSNTSENPPSALYFFIEVEKGLINSDSVSIRIDGSISELIFLLPHDAQNKQLLHYWERKETLCQTVLTALENRHSI